MPSRLLFLVIAGKILVLVAWALGLTSTAVTIGLFFALGTLGLHHLFMPGAQGLGPVTTRFATPRPEVWLTIDDGPDPEDTPRILDLLDRHRAHATFFLVGERAAQHPELVSEIARRGHEIGNHTHTHPSASFWCALPARVARELDQAADALRPATGAPPTRFRPPVGIKNFFLFPALVRRGLTCVGWSVRSGDTLRHRPEQVVEPVLRQVEPGAILLFHEGERLAPAVRVHALEGVLAGLDARGFRCVVPDAGQLR